MYKITFCANNTSEMHKHCEPSSNEEAFYDIKHAQALQTIKNLLQTLEGCRMKALLA